MDWRDVYHLMGDFSPPPEKHDLRGLKRSYICVWLREVIWLVLMRWFVILNFALLWSLGSESERKKDKPSWKKKTEERRPMERKQRQSWPWYKEGNWAWCADVSLGHGEGGLGGQTEEQPSFLDQVWRVDGQDGKVSSELEGKECLLNACHCVMCVGTEIQRVQFLTQNNWWSMGGEGLSIQYYQNNALDAVMELYSMSTDNKDVKCFLGGQKWHLRGSGCLRSVHQKQSLRWGFIEGVHLEDPGSKGSRRGQRKYLCKDVLSSCTTEVVSQKARGLGCYSPHQSTICPGWLAVLVTS